MIGVYPNFTQKSGQIGVDFFEKLFLKLLVASCMVSFDLRHGGISFFQHPEAVIQLWNN